MKLKLLKPSHTAFYEMVQGLSHKLKISEFSFASPKRCYGEEGEEEE